MVFIETPSSGDRRRDQNRSTRSTGRSLESEKGRHCCRDVALPAGGERRRIWIGVNSRGHSLRPRPSSERRNMIRFPKPRRRAAAENRNSFRGSVVDDANIDVELRVSVKRADRVIDEWPAGVHGPQTRAGTAGEDIFQQKKAGEAHPIIRGEVEVTPGGPGPMWTPRGTSSSSARA